LSAGTPCQNQETKDRGSQLITLPPEISTLFCEYNQKNEWAKDKKFLDPNFSVAYAQTVRVPV